MIGETIILIGTIVKLVEEYYETGNQNEIYYDPREENDN